MKNSPERELGFILSDDQPFTPEEEKLLANLSTFSLGQHWLQGHIAIAIVHHILDQEGTE